VASSQSPQADHAATSPPELVISPTRKYVAMAIGAAGVASIGVGLLFGGKANSAYHDAKELCGSKLVCSTDNYARGQQLIRDARSEATISTVLVAAGGAEIVPVTYGRASGLAVTGRF
jgi:hypothetical protein